MTGSASAQIRLHALEALCERLTSTGCYALAIESGLAAVAAEPLRESAHRALIKAHLAEGNRSEALRQYGRLCDLLRTDLIADPPADVTRLVRWSLPECPKPALDPDDDVLDRGSGHHLILTGFQVESCCHPRAERLGRFGFEPYPDHYDSDSFMARRSHDMYDERRSSLGRHPTVNEIRYPPCHLGGVPQQALLLALGI